MKSGTKNILIQMFFLAGIPLAGVLVAVIIHDIFYMFMFWILGWFSLSIFFFNGKVYNKGQWFGKKFCIPMGINFLILSFLIIIVSMKECPSYYSFVPKRLYDYLCNNKLISKLISLFWN